MMPGGYSLCAMAIDMGKRPHDSLKLSWAPDLKLPLYWHGQTNSRFRARVTESSIEGQFVWVIDHADFVRPVHRAEVSTADEAKQAAQDWLNESANPS